MNAHFSSASNHHIILYVLACWLFNFLFKDISVSSQKLPRCFASLFEDRNDPCLHQVLRHLNCSPRLKTETPRLHLQFTLAALDAVQLVVETRTYLKLLGIAKPPLYLARAAAPTLPILSYLSTVFLLGKIMK